MKQYKSILIAGSIALALALTIPLSTFAKGDNNQGNDNGHGGGKPVAHINMQTDQGQGHVNVIVHTNGKVTGNTKNLSAASSTFFSNLFGNFENNFSNLFGRHNGNNNGQNQNNQGDDENGSTDNDNGTTSTTTINQNLPPVISSVTSPTVLGVNQTGTWIVNASDPQNGSLTYSVNWGDNASTPFFARFFNQQSFTQTATFTHSYANTGTFTITFTVKDSVGLTTTSTVTVQVTASTTSTTGEPVISNLMATSSRPHQGTITWTTDELANSTVWFSTSSPVDTGTAASVSSSVMVTNHRITLTNLASSTVYFVLVQSRDSSGNVSTSTTSFTTTAAPITAPIISNAIALVGTSTVQVSWTTNVLADSELYFSTTSPVVIGASSTQAVTDPTLVTSHSLTASGLATSTTYYFILQSKDSGGNVRAVPQFTVTTGI